MNIFIQTFISILQKPKQCVWIFLGRSRIQKNSFKNKVAKKKSNKLENEEEIVTVKNRSKIKNELEAKEE